MCVILGSPDADCEVLRRDLAADVGRECFSELRRTGQNGSGSHTTLQHASTPLGNTVWHVHYRSKVLGFYFVCFKEMNSFIQHV